MRSKTRTIPALMAILMVLAGVITAGMMPALAQDKPEPRPAPTGLTATLSAQGILLAWDDPGDDRITEYEIERESFTPGRLYSERSVTVRQAPRQTYTDSRVEAGRTYSYQIWALSGTGKSEGSEIVTIRAAETPSPEEGGARHSRAGETADRGDPRHKPRERNGDAAEGPPYPGVSHPIAGGHQRLPAGPAQLRGGHGQQRLPGHRHRRRLPLRGHAHLQLRRRRRRNRRTPGGPHRRNQHHHRHRHRRRSLPGLPGDHRPGRDGRIWLEGTGRPQHPAGRGKPQPTGHLVRHHHPLGGRQRGRQAEGLQPPEHGAGLPEGHQPARGQPEPPRPVVHRRRHLGGGLRAGQAVRLFRQSSEPGLDRELDSNNANPWGIWSGGSVIWVADRSETKLFAYQLQNMARLSAQDIELSSGNSSPTGIWSDGLTMWVADSASGKLHAYSNAGGWADTGKDFSTLQAAGNTTPAGLWSDGKTIWVSDTGTSKVYAYNLPTSRNANLRSITIDGESIQDPSSERKIYTTSRRGRSASPCPRRPSTPGPQWSSSRRTPTTPRRDTSSSWGPTPTTSPSR